MKEMLEKVKLITMYLPILVALFTAVMRLVKEFEVAGNGAAKKQAVLDAIAAMYDALDEWIPLPKEKVLGIASEFIDLVVAFLNIVGEFTHSPATA